MKCPIYECPCHSINCPNKTLKVDDQCLIPQFKLSQQGMITTGYRRRIKSISLQYLIHNTKVSTSGSTETFLIKTELLKKTTFLQILSSLKGLIAYTRL